MALPAKGSRRILVNNHQYSWIASGNDEFVALIICDSKGKGQKLLVQLEYHYQQKDGAWLPLSITPSIVEQVIKYGMAQGWKPESNEKELNLYAVTDKLKLAA